MDLQLDSRVVLVVGATGYIGSAIAGRLADEGAIVVGASRSGDADLTIDGTDAASVAAGIAAVLAEHGRIDGVVVTAAPSLGTLDPALSSDPEQVLAAVDGKAMSFLRIASAALPAMRDRGYGRIVGISGQNAYFTGSITGSIRNAALNIAAKNLADAHAGTGITVNTVNPGHVRDEPTSTVKPAGAGDSSPDQIADLVAFLVSPRAAAISGEAIAVGHRVRGIASF
ncbi:SDR family NAD(P)-dependent oxidoreductase [Microbacterium fluvii]|uniref:SDR family NAD(P)-dependent oxidoreductase n=1 Tax=Microbacterium fluvii TaxID=415215 RepID=A0ABW2HAR5_9MICO|nr:SDR family oxidoreductase [Microbacterium fluvii]MCU4671153.1 SDR family oxidoreductase [Microbacterium fluvii]